MSARIIDGRALAKAMRDGFAAGIAALGTEGVGPMTVTMLLDNTIRSAERAHALHGHRTAASVLIG